MKGTDRRRSCYNGLVRSAVAVTLLFASTTTAWACPPPDHIRPDDNALAAVALFAAALVVMLSWSLAACSISISRDPFGTPITTDGVARLARRKRAGWLVLTALLIAPSIVVTPATAWASVAYVLAAAALGPLGLALDVHVAIVRLRRAGAYVLANERHVVVVGPRGGCVWLRADPQQLAQCAMPRATIVRSHD
jgi:hypothetical protein